MNVSVVTLVETSAPAANSEPILPYAQDEFLANEISTISNWIQGRVGDQQDVAHLLQDQSPCGPGRHCRVNPDFVASKDHLEAPIYDNDKINNESSY